MDEDLNNSKLLTSTKIQNNINNFLYPFISLSPLSEQRCHFMKGKILGAFTVSRGIQVAAVVVITRCVLTHFAIVEPITPLLRQVLSQTAPSDIRTLDVEKRT